MLTFGIGVGVEGDQKSWSDFSQFWIGSRIRIDSRVKNEVGSRSQVVSELESNEPGTRSWEAEPEAQSKVKLNRKHDSASMV